VSGDGTERNLRTSRRLSDHLLAVFHHACDQHEFDVARHLLDMAAKAVARGQRFGDARYQREQEHLVAAHERLWMLRHPMEE
jgi:hypothetical protein